MCGNHKSTSPSAIQAKNWPKTIRSEEKLDTISQLEKGERIVDLCCNVRLDHGSVNTICDNADGIKESAMSGTEVFVQQDYHDPIGMKHTKTTHNLMFF